MITIYPITIYLESVISRISNHKL
ncbi:hypothetical protein F383_00517 [Gossypium arboreum]|uniref:Uncharacterized protein n=1 Tax=Gossypium arboreum TaxID=29729 RepID=A0A0B0PP82_GOSAR|nr:hypothetical protein F383_00517 [Gossypium arboreum]